jgi:hypothetical protein
VEHLALGLTAASRPDRAFAALEGLNISADMLRVALLHHIEKAS